MKEVNWVEVGDNLVAELQLGRLVISPSELPDRLSLCNVRIELYSGEVVASAWFDLEICKDWAEANIPLMDQVIGKHRGFGNVLETLELCQQLLSRDTDATHWLRIEYIKEWIAHDLGQEYEVVNIPFVKHNQYALNWIENGKIFSAETPHGQAVIEETREKGVIAGGIRHNARIVHHTGAVLNCYSYIDFMEAEGELIKRLVELDTPQISEAHLDIMHFTLDICQRILPKDTDPIHYARISMLGTDIHLALE